MKITAEFNSIDELKEFAADFTKKADAKMTAKELNESAKKTEEIINRAEAKEEAEKKKAFVSPDITSTPEPPKKELPATPKEPDPEPKKAEDPKAWAADAEKAAAESVDPTEVKIFLSNLLRAGHKDEVKALLTKYGVKKLTELIDDKADQLAAFYAEAKEIK
jgi:hypothetical protein